MELRACYPANRIPDVPWGETLTAYWRELKDYPDPVIAAALRRAKRVHKQFFPTLGQLFELVDIECKNLKAKQQTATSERKQLPPSKQPEPEDKQTPLTKLADQMEQELREGTFNRDEAAKQISQAADEMGIGDEVRAMLPKPYTPNENDFCPSCHYLKKNHDIMNPQCGREYEPTKIAREYQYDD